MQPSAPQWIKELAEEERKRREAIEINLEQLKEFRNRLAVQVARDKEAYFGEFPKERDNILESSTESGFHVIARIRSESSNSNYQLFMPRPIWHRTSQNDPTMLVSS
jgi:hypothetical protein